MKWEVGKLIPVTLKQFHYKRLNPSMLAISVQFLEQTWTATRSPIAANHIPHIVGVRIIFRYGIFFSSFFSVFSSESQGKRPLLIFSSSALSTSGCSAEIIRFCVFREWRRKGELHQWMSKMVIRKIRKNLKFVHWKGHFDLGGQSSFSARSRKKNGVTALEKLVWFTCTSTFCLTDHLFL